MGQATILDGLVDPGLADREALGQLPGGHEWLGLLLASGVRGGAHGAGIGRPPPTVDLSEPSFPRLGANPLRGRAGGEGCYIDCYIDLLGPATGSALETPKPAFSSGF